MAGADPPDDELAQSRKAAEQAIEAHDLSAAHRLNERAYGLPGGADDFETVLLRGQIAQKRTDLPTAFEMASRARKLAQSDADRQRRARDFEARLLRAFGVVTLGASPAQDYTVGRIELELDTKTPIVNRRKRRALNETRLQLAAGDITLPRVVYLPHGVYKANSVAFSVTPESPKQEIKIYLRAPPEGSGDPIWWYVGGAGAATAVAAAIVISLLLTSSDESAEPRMRVSFP